LKKFSSFVESADKKLAPAATCWYFCWHREIKRSRRIFAIPNDAIEQMARKNDGAGANPKQI
jgi:hypothetical protein